MKKLWQAIEWCIRIVVGASVFSLGFVLFLDPHNFNGGGVSGLAQIMVKLTGLGTVALWVALINIPLFIIGGLRVGRKFFVGSLVGIVSVTATLELFRFLPVPETEPLLACLYGGACIGLGVGIVFMAGASTGGSDIVVRLLKMKWRNVPIGTINMCFDLVVMVLTGFAFGDMSKALYTGVTVFLAGKVLDMMVYSFDYSKVVLIISEHHELIADDIFRKLDRGVTYLDGEGAYSGREKKVILSVVKRHQLADLKQLVVDIDTDAFVIVQEAHQVLGDGFSRYTKDSL